MAGSFLTLHRLHPRRPPVCGEASPTHFSLSDDDIYRALCDDAVPGGCHPSPKLPSKSNTMDVQCVFGMIWIL